MKKVLATFFFTVSLSIGSSAFAVPIMTFNEVFDRNLAVEAGHRAIYRFDLTGVGGASFVRDSHGDRVTRRFRPTVDETDFDPSYDVLSAALSFEIGGMDGGAFVPDEHIKIRVAGEDGTGAVLMNETVSLGVDVFTFNLTGTWLNWLDDGKLRAVALAVETEGFVNDFRMRSASLSVEAAAKVATPGVLLLFSSALIGGLLLSRRRK